MSKAISKVRSAVFAALIAAVVFVASLFVACGTTPDGTTSQDVVLRQTFTLDKTAVEITVDSVDVLTLTITNIDDEIRWESSDAGIATVTVQSSANRATVRGVGEGAALITVSAGEYYAVCAVVVKPGIYITPDKSAIDLWKGATESIAVDTNYTGTLTYSSNNTSVATVSDSGLVSAIAGGSATITISGGNKSATVTVNVTEPVVTLDKTFAQLLTGDTVQLTATASAEGDVEWHSANNAVATVDETGLVTAAGEGETVITVTFKSAEATCTVKVKGELLTVTLDKDEITLGNDKQSDTLSATVISSASGELSGDDANVTWSIVSGGSLVFINQDGVVTWKKAADNYGTAVVRATSDKDPDAYAECTVTIPSPYADWIAISDRASLESALSAGNEYRNMYLTANIDLGGASLSSGLNTYSGTFDGMGYTISNYSGYLCHNLSGTIKNLSVICTTDGIQAGFGALMHHVNGGGVVKDCLIDVTYSGNLMGGIAYESNGAINNVIIFARNTNGVSEAFAAVNAGSGTLSNVFYVPFGNVVAGRATQKTEDDLKNPSTFDDTWYDGWVIIDGELPKLKNVNVKEPLKIAVDKTSAEMYVGENTTITAIVTPFDLSDSERAVVWSSSDASVATVDRNGVVTALKAGTVTVTVTSATEKSKSATCEITVNAITLSIDPEDIITALKIGGAKQLHATVNRGGVVWETSDATVAAVSADGLVTAVKAGTVTITVRSALDNTVSDSMTFDVSASVEITVAFDEDTLDLDRGATATLRVTVTNSDGGVTWESSNTSVATVDEHGVVTTFGVDGTATITATAKEDDGNGNYAFAECVVTVAYVAEVVTVEQTELLMPTNSVVTLAEIATASKGELALTLKSGSADGVISLQNNKITAVGAGTVTVLLTWSIEYADVEDKVTEITVEVYEPTVVMSIDTAKRTLKVGETSAANILHVTMNVMPSEPSADDIVWTSSNASVVSTVSAGYSENAYTGTLNTVGTGYTVITATYTVGKIEYTVSCEVAVVNVSGTAVYNAAGFRNIGAGYYYISNDIDMGGVTVTGWNQNAKINGMGYTVSNFVTPKLVGGEAFEGEIRNIKLVCDLGGGSGGHGLFGLYTLGATVIENCIFEVDFTASPVKSVLAHHAVAGTTVNNVVIIISNTVGDGGNAPGFYITDGGLTGSRISNAFYMVNAGHRAGVAFGVTLKTESQLKSVATYDDSWLDNWVLTDGEMPELMLVGFPQAHRHTFESAWTTDESNHWHAAACEHTDETKDFGAHDGNGLEGECSVCGHFPEGVHRHAYTDEYASDETNHWKTTTCADHDEEIGLLEAHNTNGVGNSCSVCGYKPELSYDLSYSPEAGMPSDRWVYWKGNDATEAAKTISGTYNNDTLSVTFSENSGDWWATQLFYKDSAITNNGAARISMTITSTVSGSITVNGQVIALKAGVAYEFSGNGANGNALISIQMGVDGQTNSISAATITFSNITITQ